MLKCRICAGRKVVATTERIVISCPHCGKIKPELLCNCNEDQNEDQIEHDHGKEIENHGVLEKWKGAAGKGTRIRRNIKNQNSC